MFVGSVPLRRCRRLGNLLGYSCLVLLANSTIGLAQTSIKEYIRLGGRLVAIENTQLAVSPASITISTPGQSVQFAASLSGNPTTAVTWSISPSNVGQISASGLYTAPGSITIGQVVTIIATSMTDSGAVGTASVGLQPATFSTPALIPGNTTSGGGPPFNCAGGCPPVSTGSAVYMLTWNLTTFAMQVTRTTDGMTFSSPLDASHAPTINSGANYQAVAWYYLAAASTLYIAYLPKGSTAVSVITFSTATNTYGPVNPTGIVPAATVNNFGVELEIAVRSNKSIVLFYSGPAHKVKGTNYDTVYYSIYTTKWSAGAAFTDTTDNTDQEMSVWGTPVVDSTNDMIHLLFGRWSRPPSEVAAHRSLSLSGTFGTQENVPANLSMLANSLAFDSVKDRVYAVGRNPLGPGDTYDLSVFYAPSTATFGSSGTTFVVSEAKFNGGENAGVSIIGSKIVIPQTYTSNSLDLIVADVAAPTNVDIVISAVPCAVQGVPFVAVPLGNSTLVFYYQFNNGVSVPYYVLYTPPPSTVPNALQDNVAGTTVAGSSISVTLNHPTNANDLLAVAVAWKGPASTPVISSTSTSGSGWRTIAGPSCNSDGKCLYTGYLSGISGSQTEKISASISAGFTDASLTVVEYSNLNVTAPLDSVIAANSTTGSGGTDNVGTISTARPNEILFTAFVDTQNTVPAWLPQPSTARSSGDNSTGGWLETFDLLVYLPGSTTVALVPNGDGNFLAHMAAFKQ